MIVFRENSEDIYAGIEFEANSDDAVKLIDFLTKEMGVKNILNREREIHRIVWEKFSQLKNVHVLASNFSERLGVYSFYIDHLHFNLAVQLLNDKFGIQVRGGCSCAGTYGHILLNVKKEESCSITTKTLLAASVIFVPGPNIASTPAFSNSK